MNTNLENFIDMVSHAFMPLNYTKTDDIIVYEGEEVSVIRVKVFVSESGDYCEAVFHKGTEDLLDMNIKHICTCHSHGHHHKM